MGSGPATCGPSTDPTPLHFHLMCCSSSLNPVHTHFPLPLPAIISLTATAFDFNNTHTHPHSPSTLSFLKTAVFFFLSRHTFPPHPLVFSFFPRRATVPVLFTWRITAHFNLQKPRRVFASPSSCFFSRSLSLAKSRAERGSFQKKINK